MLAFLRWAALLGVLAVLGSAICLDPHAWMSLLHLADSQARQYGHQVDAHLPRPGRTAAP